MPIEVEAPDGSVVEFPDGMSDDAIAQAMARNYGGPKPTSQALGFFKGAMTPIDNAAMALEWGAGKLGVPTDRINSALGLPSAAQAADQRAQAIAAQPKTPGDIGEFFGNVVGTIPAAMATRNPWVAGGLAGAALTDSRDAGGIALDAGIGAIGGKIADKLLKGAGAVIAPKLDHAVQRLQAMGIRLTPGQQAGGKAMIREDKLMSKPVVGDMIRADRIQALDDFNIAALNRALQPLKVAVPEGTAPGFEAVQFGDDAVSAAYNAVIPKLKLSVQPEALTKGASVPSQLQSEFDRIVAQHVGTGNLSGRGLKNAEGELRRLASTYARSQNASERELGFALGRVYDRLTAAMVAQNPVEAPALKAANRAFRGLATVQDAAGRGVDGVFTPNQLSQAVRRGDSSARKSASSTGTAYMQDFSNAAKKVLPAKYPDTGTAGRLQAGVVGNLRGGASALGYQTGKAVAAVPRPPGSALVADFLTRDPRLAQLMGSAVAVKTFGR